MVVLLSLFHSDVYGSLWMLYRSIDAVQFHRLVTDVFQKEQASNDNYFNMKQMLKRLWAQPL